jgi:hypothetical protein
MDKLSLYLSYSLMSSIFLPLQFFCFAISVLNVLGQQVNLLKIHIVTVHFEVNFCIYW